MKGLEGEYFHYTLYALLVTHKADDFNYGVC